MEHFVKIMMMIVICHLTLIELSIDRIWHHLRNDGDYRIPKSVIVILWFYAAVIISYIVEACMG